MIKVVLLGKTWTLLPTMTNDAAGHDAHRAGPLGPGAGRHDRVPQREQLRERLRRGQVRRADVPGHRPDRRAITDAQLDNVWKTANGDQHCLIVETYAGGSLLSTHGTPASPAMCTTSSTTWATNTLGLGEVNTPARANELTVRLYGWGGNKIDFDRVALKLTWNLGTWDAQRR